MQQVFFYSPGEIPDDRLRLVVLTIQTGDRWLFLRRGERGDWTLPYGEIAPGESPAQAARRLLREETGAEGEGLSPVCIFEESGYGMLFFVRLKEGERLPRQGQGMQLGLFELPPAAEEEGIFAQLFHKVQAWKNLQASSDELWDLYGEDRRKTGAFHRRGDPLPKGARHLAVHVWIRQPDGRFFLTRRAFNKGYPGMWETTGGSALAGDDSLTAALRETREETGLLLRPEKGRLVLQRTGEDYFLDVWLFDQAVDGAQVRLQEGETIAYTFAAPEEILAMWKKGSLVPFSYLDQLFSFGNT